VRQDLDVNPDLYKALQSTTSGQRVAGRNHPNPPFFRICRSVFDLLRVVQENADFEFVEQEIAIIAKASFVGPMKLRLSNQEVPVLATYA
jgi:hypothetical protein